MLYVLSVFSRGPRVNSIYYSMSKNNCKFAEKRAESVRANTALESKIVWRCGSEKFVTGMQETGKR